LPTDGEPGSPHIVRKGNQWWLHPPIEKQFNGPGNREKQITNPKAKICSIDVNLGNHLAVCIIQTIKGTILATRFIGGGKAINGSRKRQLGRIACNWLKTDGITAEGQVNSADLRKKLRQVDKQAVHLNSQRIVDFALAHEATVLEFEYPGRLKPFKGKYD
jgi:putative transposase